MAVFADRATAGRRLAEQLEYLRGQDVVVLGLPRGGLPVAFEVALALDVPLDVIVVRKLGLPFQPELAMGAIGEGGVEVLDEQLVARAGVSEEELHAVERHERHVLESRVARLRRGRGRHSLRGRTAVVVDDGIATGSTARAACEVARRLGASKVILAAPVAPVSITPQVIGADEVVCVATPDPFLAVGHHYQDFSPTTDGEVASLLESADRIVRRRPAAVDIGDCEVEIPAGSVTLNGHLYLPDHAVGVVVFAHGSGSSRHSPRNRYVASVLRRSGLGTLLLDLLTAEEEVERSKVFDVSLQATRLSAATSWLRHRPDAATCRVGYFGASTGAGAALVAAADAGSDIAAVVSRGGRPDLAASRLAEVTAPTLLIVGGLDPTVLRLNEEARALLRCASRLAVVKGATHLFEEPGTLAEAALLASDWFTRYLMPIVTPVVSPNPTDRDLGVPSPSDR